MNGILIVALVCGILALVVNLVAIAWMLGRRRGAAEATVRFVADPLDDTVPSFAPRHRAPTRVTGRAA